MPDYLHTSKYFRLNEALIRGGDRKLEFPEFLDRLRLFVASKLRFRDTKKSAAKIQGDFV